MTISPEEVLLAGRSCLLSQSQDFMNFHVAQIPITPNQQGTMDMREDLFSGVGAQDFDTSGYEVCHPDDLGLYWRNDQLSGDAVFRPLIGTQFSTTILDVLEMGGSEGKSNLLDKEEEKEKSPPTTPVPERPALPAKLLSSRLFETAVGNVPAYDSRKLFQELLRCVYFDIKINQRVAFFQNLLL